MPCGIHGGTDRRDIIDAATGGIDLHDQDRFDFGSGIFAQACFKLCRVDGAAPAAGQAFDIEPHFGAHVAPADGEASALAY